MITYDLRLTLAVFFGFFAVMAALGAGLTWLLSRKIKRD